MKPCLCALGLFLFFSAGLAGCKPKAAAPKTTVLMGQVFVAARPAEMPRPEPARRGNRGRGGPRRGNPAGEAGNAEYANLGGVEILLIEKTRAVAALQKKQSAVQQLIESRQQELTAATEALQKVQADRTDYLANRRLTNADYLRMTAKLDELKRRIIVLEPLRGMPLAQQYPDQKFTPEQTAELLQQQQAANEEYKQKTAEVTALRREIMEFTRVHDVEEAEKVTLARKRLAAARTAVEHPPAIADRLPDFTADSSSKTFTDTDGRFSLTYARDQAFTLFAKARRELPGGVEDYCWLIDAPAGTDTAEVFLSNSGLISVDPDGYFKAKPAPPK